MIWVARIFGLALALCLLDRVLLSLEARGWIFYRRTRGWRGRAMYHAQELDSIFNPGMEHVQEARVRSLEEADEDDSGEPPVPGNG
jgi:hypothetical protein